MLAQHYRALVNKSVTLKMCTRSHTYNTHVHIGFWIYRVSSRGHEKAYTISPPYLISIILVLFSLPPSLSPSFAYSSVFFPNPPARIINIPNIYDARGSAINRANSISELPINKYALARGRSAVAVAKTATDRKLILFVDCVSRGQQPAQLLYAARSLSLFSG